MSLLEKTTGRTLLYYFSVVSVFAVAVLVDNVAWDQGAWWALLVVKRIPGRVNSEGSGPGGIRCQAGAG